MSNYTNYFLGTKVLKSPGYKMLRRFVPLWQAVGLMPPGREGRLFQPKSRLVVNAAPCLSQHPPSALNRAYWEMLSPYKTKKRRDTSSSLPLFITGARNQRPPAWTVEVTAIRASSRAQEEQISRFKPRNTSLHREPISLTVHVDCSCLQDGFGLSPSRSTSLGGVPKWSIKASCLQKQFRTRAPRTGCETN